MMSEELLSAAERRAMLSDIGQVALAVGREIQGGAAPDPLEAESGATPGTLSGRERLEFLAAHLPAIERAVARIAAAPRTALRRETRQTPSERVRHPAPHAAIDAVRRGDLLPFTPSSLHPLTPALATRLGGRLPHTLKESLLVVTTDTPENRYVAGLLADWRRDLRAIAAFAEWEEDEAVRAQALALESRLKTVEIRELRVEGRESRLVTDALLRDFRYRALYDLDRRYHRLLQYAWEAPALLLLPKEPWRLYEMWCFFQAAAALRSAGLRVLGGDVVRMTRGRLTIMLAKGQASRLVFRCSGAQVLGSLSTVSLYYNRAFPGAAVGSRQAASRTHTMIPDICLERAGRFLLLDAKFRLYDLPGEEPEGADGAGGRDFATARANPALYEDVDKMHAYRDAIHREGQSVVDGAWCLFPGRRQDNPDIIAYPASTPPEPFGRAGVGAIRLRPGEEAGLFARLLAEWLASSPTA